MLEKLRPSLGEYRLSPKFFNRHEFKTILITAMGKEIENKKVEKYFIRCALQILQKQEMNNRSWLVGWFVGLYGISTFVGYLTPNPFLCK